MASDPNANIDKGVVDARQGTSRPKLIYVLGASLALIVVVFAAVWLSTSH